MSYLRVGQFARCALLLHVVIICFAGSQAEGKQPTVGLEGGVRRLHQFDPNRFGPGFPRFTFPHNGTENGTETGVENDDGLDLSSPTVQTAAQMAVEQMNEDPGARDIAGFVGNLVLMEVLAVAKQTTPEGTAWEIEVIAEDEDGVEFTIGLTIDEPTGDVEPPFQLIQAVITDISEAAAAPSPSSEDMM